MDPNGVLIDSVPLPRNTVWPVCSFSPGWLILLRLLRPGLHSPGKSLCQWRDDATAPFNEWRQGKSDWNDLS